MRARLTVLALTLAVAMMTLVSTAAPATARAVPDKATWRADVAAVMAGSQDLLAERAASAAEGERLAINLDIDNTSLASYYSRGRPVRPVLAFAQRAHELGYAVFFNTARLPAAARGVRQQLRAVGYVVDALCTRTPDESRPTSKQRCRASFVAQGYSIVANVGNNGVDFVGGDYEVGLRLPNYGGELG